MSRDPGKKSSNEKKNIRFFCFPCQGNAFYSKEPRLHSLSVCKSVAEVISFFAWVQLYEAFRQISGHHRFLIFTQSSFSKSNFIFIMGISRDSWHKRYKTGATRPVPHKKRKFELGRPAANTKIGPKRVHVVRVRGGNFKYRALRLDAGNFSWASEQTTRKTRIVDTVYNSTNNELVRTKTLVKGTIVTIDAAPFRQWYESHYALPLARKKNAKLSDEDSAVLNKKRSRKTTEKYTERQKTAEVDPLLIEQFHTGRILARLSSSPGQVGHADGYILEGKELDFYLRKIRAKKAK
ncbi:unnamed protein product [Caenorhabditis auriculariae]|uniref:40S ribosomal protein S8 n=1 Tax=Caenorhabditis auriculariae TaxID=2777116 RepID=A0A8S1GQM5_9PELO|nr:unnamed protein product [Caenorhabditis auriculariae]